jgi:hypothetical protein
MSDIAVGDTIRHHSVPPGPFDVTVLAVKPCEGDGGEGDHPSYLIKDPETGEPDWVCSRDFVKVT